MNNFRKVLRESQYEKEVVSMTDAEIFDALRLQMIRLSTIGLANGDFVIEAAGLPALQGAFESWTEMVGLLLNELPARH